MGFIKIIIILVTVLMGLNSKKTKATLFHRRSIVRNVTSSTRERAQNGNYRIECRECYFQCLFVSQLTWNSTTSGKVRWSWAYEIHRPSWPRPSRPTITMTSSTPKIIVETTRPPRTGGCHLVRTATREKIDACICTGASLEDLDNVPDTVETIVYSASVIPTIRNDVFRKFGRYLRRLEFRECAVQSIERRAFYGLRRLETLVIRGNDLEHVRSEWFEETSELKRLDLGRNGITRISNGVFDRLPNLASLDVSDNRMNCIGIEHLEALANLRQLEIVGNPWTCLCATRLLQLMNERRISCNCNPEVILERTEGGWGCDGTNDFPTTR